MPMTTAGRNVLCRFMVGDGTTTPDQVNTFFTNARAALGVGDSSTAFAAGQTDLQAATNKLRKGMDATYPQVSTNVITAVAQFGSSEANFAWNEVGFFNSVTAGQGTMLSRVVASGLGTKASGSVWTLSYSLTIGVS